MSNQVISIANAPGYHWGGPNGTDCDGWHLVATTNLSVIQELMPPGTSEAWHSHIQARQFFFLLPGELTVELESQVMLLLAGEGLEVAPGLQHQVMNRSEQATSVLVISQPPSHGDRSSANDRCEADQNAGT